MWRVQQEAEETPVDCTAPACIMPGSCMTSAVRVSLTRTDMSNGSTTETGAGPADRHSSSAAKSLCSMQQWPSMGKTYLQQELCFTVTC